MPRLLNSLRIKVNLAAMESIVASANRVANVVTEASGAASVTGAAEASAGGIEVNVVTEGTADIVLRTGLLTGLLIDLLTGVGNVSEVENVCPSVAMNEPSAANMKGNPPTWIKRSL